MKFWLRYFGLLWLVLPILAACATSVPDDIQNAPMAPTIGNSEVAATTRPDTYKLMPGDELRIGVFNQEEMSGEYRIDAGGDLSFPLLGTIQVRDMTVRALRDTLVEQLDREFLVNPRVSVEVISYRPVFILGEVEDPGRFDYEVGMTVRKAVAVSGGYTRRARQDVMAVVRPDPEGRPDTYKADEDTIILPGDTIEIFRRVF